MARLVKELAAWDSSDENRFPMSMGVEIGGQDYSQVMSAHPDYIVARLKSDTDWFREKNYHVYHEKTWYSVDAFLQEFTAAPEPKVELNFVEPGRPASVVTRTINLTVTVDDYQDWRKAYTQVAAAALEMHLWASAISLTSYEIEDDELISDDFTTHYTEETLAKVATGLRKAGLTELQILHSVNAMQNNGILFRERSS